MEEFEAYSGRILGRGGLKAAEEKWMKLQGPYSPALLQFLKDNRKEYDCFIFFTYLYFTTYFGLPLVADRAILIPTAHDEKPIYLGIFQSFFKKPAGIFYNTRTEKEFVEKLTGNSHIRNNAGLGGVGVEIPDSCQAERFRKKYGNDPFMLYIGRIEPHKGCGELFGYYKEFSKTHPGIKLMLMGKPVMEIPALEGIESLGFVTDEDKFDGLAACDFLVLPSEFESLSMVVLEAMKLKKPVLVNGRCEVLKQHCLLSNGGLYFTDYPEFEGCAEYLLAHPEETKQMGENGAAYVEENYRWDVIVERLKALMDAAVFRR